MLRLVQKRRVRPLSPEEMDQAIRESLLEPGSNLPDLRLKTIHGDSSLLLIVGEPDGDHDYLARVRQQVANMAHRGRVRFLDFQTDIRFVECAADVQVLCSENEPLGTCILESMSLGVPVVVSDAGGLKEIVEDGVSGFVVPAGDAGMLADRIALLLCDIALRDQMGTSARAVIERDHSIERCAEEMLRIYHEVCAGWSTLRSSCSDGVAPVP